MEFITKRFKKPSGFIRPWSTYMCSCQENCGKFYSNTFSNTLYLVNCLCVPTLLPCFMCELFHYVFGYQWWPSLVMGIFLTPFAPFIIIAARIVLRKKHQLQGNLLADVFCTLLCFLNSACQVRDEIFTLRRDHIWELKNPPPPGEPEYSPYILPIVEAFRDIKEGNCCKKKGGSDDDKSSGSESSESDSESGSGSDTSSSD
ncbi:unnamed protein product [Rodentolepis nana]|uniref:Transmembrane protein n=1 Tax=Rodentolepis nana TaxID=102285 RepID=A0A0R3TRY9_RODNA|nr:unnamed protein product [Rodentolepis nana]